MNNTHLDTLRYGVANLEARVAEAKRRADLNPTFGPGWVELDRAQWALSDMRMQLRDAEALAAAGPDDDLVLGDD